MFTLNRVRRYLARTSLRSLPAVALASAITACSDQAPPPAGPTTSDRSLAAARPAPPVLVWSPATSGGYNFGTFDAGTASSQAFALTNSGASASGAVTIALSGSTAFSITSDACTGVALAAGRSCSVTVRYAQAVASHNDQATLAASSPKPTATGASITLLGATKAPPPPHIYWSNYTAGTIGRADIDGSNVNQSFITGVDHPGGLAVHGNYVYWANTGSNSIGRAKLDGSEANPNFITGASFALGAPTGVAVDGSHIYWTNYPAFPQSAAIGRANLDGTGVNQTYVADPDPVASSVALDGTHIYWTSGSHQGGGSVWRANLDGTAVVDLINLGLPASVAVDATHIFWSDDGFTTSAIGRSNLDGTGITAAFISFQDCCYKAVAIDASYVYWTDGAGTIGRAKLDGTDVNSSFITGATSPFGLAVGPR